MCIRDSPSTSEQEVNHRTSGFPEQGHDREQMQEVSPNEQEVSHRNLEQGHTNENIWTSRT